MKVYAVYSIPKSPEYKLEKLFKTKESAKKFISKQFPVADHECIFDLQIEEVEE